MRWGRLAQVHLLDTRQHRDFQACRAPNSSGSGSVAPKDCPDLTNAGRSLLGTAQERWLEVSSVSNFETFQTNRMKVRYRDENKKTILCHSLNGSAMALPRIVAGILENHQKEDGIYIPKALQPYTGFDKIV